MNRYTLTVHYKLKGLPLAFDTCVDCEDSQTAKHLVVIEFARREKSGVFEKVFITLVRSGNKVEVQK